jgi:hypothetical protein
MSPLPTDPKTLRIALKLAKKKIRVLGDKQLNTNLDMFCGDFAEAYRCGVEEAQAEIVGRLAALQKGVS